MRQRKVVIITGASSGIGWETALEAAQQGYRIVAAARRRERLEELVAKIEASGGSACAVPCDVTQAEDQQRVIDTALERYGRLDVLVNNAGVPLAHTFTDAPLPELRRQWQTNVLSVVELTKRALPALIDARGIVINVSSLASRMALPGWGMYFPTKIAVSSISEALRRELMAYSVQVCLVEPGPFQTEFSLRAGARPDRTGGLPPEWVARAIVRLFEHPRRLVVVPFWMRPFAALIGGLMRFVPGLVDLAYRLIARQRQRDAKRSTSAG